LFFAQNCYTIIFKFPKITCNNSALCFENNSLDEQMSLTANNSQTIFEAFFAAPEAVSITVVGQRGLPDECFSVPLLRQHAAAAANHLRGAGVKVGARVALFLPTSPALLQAMLGSWMAGAAFTVLPERVGTERSALALEKLQMVFDLLRPAVLVVDDDGGAVADYAAAQGVRVITARELLAAPAAAQTHWPTLDDDAFFQLTSGSTGTPKIVPVQFRQLLANLRSLNQRADIQADDRMVGWIPLYHDMGLVCGLMQALYSGISLCLIPTALFIRSPLVWLQKASDFRATLSMGPSFAFQLFGRRNKAAAGRDLDLSRLRYLWMGAEPVYLEHIQTFEAALAPVGLRSGVVKASYGLAETVVGVACTAASAASRATWLDQELLRGAGRVQMMAAHSPGSLSITSCGTPLDGVTVQIVDDRGAPVPEDRVGHIVVSGSSVMRGYLGEEPVAASGFDTGDLGFLHAGELHITGRVKDVIIRGGTNIGCHEVEAQVAAVLGVRPGKIIAFSLPDPVTRRERVVVGVEWRGADPDALRRQVRDHVAVTLSLQVDDVIVLGAGSIPRTTSGKLQRLQARELYQQGRLDLSASV
jgi:fatty-acyl-CoA synthase